MMTIPIGLDRSGKMALPFTSYILLVILEDDNMERLKEHDPGEVPVSKLPEPWCRLKLDWIQLVYASPDEVRTLMSLARDEVPAYVKRTLYRGWKFRPEKGDNDSGFQRPKDN